MRYSSMLAYLKSEADRAAADAAMRECKIAGDIRNGGIAEATEDASGWSVVPEFLVLDARDADDVMKAVSELSEKAPEGETNLIVVGDDNDIAFYRRLKMFGVTEYMTSPIDKDDFVNVIRGIIEDKRKRGLEIDPSRLVAVTGVRGGAGASTVASIVADAIARRHNKKTLLIDLDIETGVHHLNHNIEPTAGIVGMFESPERIDALFLDRVISRVDKGLSLISGNAPGEDRTLSEDALKQMILQAHQGFDMVVLDVPNRPLLGKRALFSAGTVILVTPPTLVGLRDTVAFYDYLEGNKFAHEVWIIVNRVGEFSQGIVRAAEFRKRMNCLVAEIPFDPKTVSQAFVQNKSLLESSGPFGKSVKFLVSKLPTASEEKKTLVQKILGV